MTERVVCVGQTETGLDVRAGVGYQAAQGDIGTSLISINDLPFQYFIPEHPALATHTGLLECSGISRRT